jgi:hypothetical protein
LSRRGGRKPRTKLTRIIEDERMLRKKPRMQQTMQENARMEKGG